MSSDLKLSRYSATPASNNSSPPNGAPENMAPSTVNDVMRTNMARLREWYVEPDWINDGIAKSFSSGTVFSVSTQDVTSIYKVGRRIQAIGNSTGTIYGTITASTYSVNTSVTVSWDSGNLFNEPLIISYGGDPTANGDVNNVGNSVVVRDANGVMAGTATSARYADLAEKYTTNWATLVGWVMVIDTDEQGAEVRPCVKSADDSVVGVISQNPAFRMNADLDNSVYIALRGRVPVKVVGNVSKGDLLVASSTLGCARRATWYDKTFRSNAVFAKALSNRFENETVEAVIL